MNDNQHLYGHPDYYERRDRRNQADIDALIRLCCEPVEGDSGMRQFLVGFVAGFAFGLIGLLVL